MKYAIRIKTGVLLVLVLAFGLSLARAALSGEVSPGRSWASTPRHSAGIAPDPQALAEIPIVQVYAAPTYGWRGIFAVHSWIIFKRAGETRYTRYDVIGWGSGNVVRQDYAIPDGLWFGARPHLLVDRRGEGVEALIDQVDAAIRSYPYAESYRAWPGPNSNTFVAHIGREVPALGLDLPANAIGKDYRPLTQPLGRSSSGKGVQVSLFGLLGLNLGWEEGIELNLLGLNVGIDVNRPGLRLPFVGRVGMDDTARQGVEGNAQP